MNCALLTVHRRIARRSIASRSAWAGRLTLHSAAVAADQRHTSRGEVVAIAEHIASLTAAAAAFQLSPDVPVATRAERNEPLIPFVDDSTAGESAETLREIKAWARHALAIDHTPAVWRAMANDPRLLDTTWRKDRLVLGAGVLDELIKACVALAIAASITVIRLFVYPSAWTENLVWASILVMLLTRGAGALSVDFLIDRYFEKQTARS
jgi:hypothetical protein